MSDSIVTASAPTAEADQNDVPSLLGPPVVDPSDYTLDHAIDEVLDELGMDRESASDALELVSRLAAWGQGLQAQRAAAAHEQKVAGYVESSKFDSEIGGEKMGEQLAIAKHAMFATTTPAYRQMLEATGLGSHPEMIRMFLKIAPAYSESKWVGGGRPVTPDRDGVKSFYPTMNAASEGN